MQLSHCYRIKNKGKKSSRDLPESDSDKSFSKDYHH
jgi:hypothetical protein